MGLSVQPHPTSKVEVITYSTVVTEHSTTLITTSNSFGTTVWTDTVAYNSTVPVTSSYTTMVQPTSDSTGGAATQHTSGRWADFVLDY